MAPIQLNYTTLGRKSFQVYSCKIYSGDIQIEEILKGVCKKWDQENLLRWSDFWLVRYIATLNHWTEGRPTFSS